MNQADGASRILRDEHRGIAAMLRSLLPLAARGPGDEPERFFDIMRAMLFYIDEFPQQRHHPLESDLLFPKLVRCAPELMPVIERLESDHLHGESRVRELQHLLLAWELVGESRRAPFIAALDEYVAFYLEHMRIEEEQLLPVLDRGLPATDRAELDLAFSAARDPLAGGVVDPVYHRLFTRIVMITPEPLGVGRALAGCA